MCELWFFIDFICPGFFNRKTRWKIKEERWRWDKTLATTKTWIMGNGAGDAAWKGIAGLAGRNEIPLADILSFIASSSGIKKQFQIKRTGCFQCSTPDWLSATHSSDAKRLNCFKDDTMTTNCRSLCHTAVRPYTWRTHCELCLTNYTGSPWKRAVSFSMLQEMHCHVQLPPRMEKLGGINNISTRRHCLWWSLSPQSRKKSRMYELCFQEKQNRPWTHFLFL